MTFRMCILFSIICGLASCKHPPASTDTAYNATAIAQIIDSICIANNDTSPLPNTSSISLFAQLTPVINTFARLQKDSADIKQWNDFGVTLSTKIKIGSLLSVVPPSSAGEGLGVRSNGYQSPTEPPAPLLSERGEKLNRNIITQIYTTWHITFNPDRNDINGLLPHRVVNSGNGSCVGVSLLYLLLAEKLNVSLHGVLLPTHFFVRLHDKAHHINFEPNRNGFSYTDSEYYQKYGLTQNDTLRMRELTNTQVTAVLAYNVGNYCLQKGNMEDAVVLYCMAIKRFPQFAEVWGNLGIALSTSNRNSLALAACERAYVLDSLLPDIRKNLGVLQRRMAMGHRGVKCFIGDARGVW